MANDYAEGYEAGARGEMSPGGGAMEYAGYLAGKEAYDKKPKAHVDGVAFTALACAYIVCLIYPIAGAAALGALLLTWGLAELTGMAGTSIWVLPLMLLAALVAFFPGFAVERRLAYRKSYRSLRNVYRIGLMALIPISMLMTTGSDVPDGGVIFFAFAMIPAAYWLLKRLAGAVGAAGAD